MKDSNVIITGIGFVTSIGCSRSDVVASLRGLEHGLAAWSPAPGLTSRVKLAGQVRCCDLSSTQPSAWTWPKEWPVEASEVRAMPPHGVYALAAVRQALTEARLNEAELHDERTGLFCASVGSPRMQHHHLTQLEASGWQRVHPNAIIGSVAGTLNFHLGALLGIRGSNCGFVSACSSGSHALGFALDELRLGRQDRMIVVAADELSAETVLPFAALNALSLQENPRLASRPFDQGREGFVACGGAVAMVIETKCSAAQRGARGQARMLGWAQASDGHHVVMPHPTGRGIGSAMRLALRDAGTEPATVDYVNAHATSTPAGDRAEALALAGVFREQAAPAVSSTKALTGHGLSLAGLMEAAFCVLALDHGFIPGQAHLAEPDEASAALNLPRVTLNDSPRFVMNNSSGFGGSNVVHVFGRD